MRSAVRMRSCARSVSATGPATTPRRCRAANSSGSRLPAPRRRDPTSSSPTSPPAISTRRPEKRSWSCSSACGTSTARRSSSSPTPRNSPLAATALSGCATDGSRRPNAGRRPNEPRPRGPHSRPGASRRPEGVPGVSGLPRPRRRGHRRGRQRAILDWRGARTRGRRNPRRRCRDRAHLPLRRTRGTRLDRGYATEVSEIVDFRSLATADGGDDRRRGLTQVKGVDAAYPLYGEVRLEPAMSLSEALAGKAGLPGAVMDPVLIGVLDIEVGDTIRLGTQDFVLSAALLREPDSAGGGFELGPRTIVLTDDLADSGLLSPGTLFESAYRMRLPDGADLAELRAEAGELFTGARWRDRRNGAPGVSEFVDRLGAFLVLVGLAGLAVGGVGVSAAVRAYLDRKTAVVAILRTLGAEASTIFLTYFIQVGALALVGIAAGLVLGAALPIVFAPLIADALPVPAVFTVHLRPLAEAALYGALAALLFTLWPLARTEEVRAAALFRDAAGGLRTLPRPLWVGATAAILAALVATAAAFSGLVDLTLATAGGILGAFVLLLLAAAGIRRLARVLARSPALRGRTTLRLALGAVGGPGSEAGSVVLSLGLGLPVLAAVGQIDANLRGAIERDLPKVAPSFFMVDIQTAQLDPFLGGLRQNPAVSRV